MIVVLGRPGLTADDLLDRPAALIARSAVEAGGQVELVGSVGDDPDGDTVIVELGQVGIGHAAVLRDPAGQTPRAGADDGGPLPRLDAADVELGLRYIADCQVLVVAEQTADDVLHVAVDAAAYHRAALVVLTDPGTEPGSDLPETATVLVAPAEDAGAFSELVGRYSAFLDAGRGAADAWRDAIAETGWEPATE